MAHIVYITYGSAGFYNATAQLTQDLAANGHHITYVSWLDIGEVVQHSGFAFVHLKREWALRSSPEQQATERMGMRARWRNRRRVTAARKILRDFMVHGGELDEVLDELKPDLVMVDSELHPHVMVTAARDIPLILVQTWFYTLRKPDMPPLNSLLQPRGLLHGVRIDLRWRLFLLVRMAKRWFADQFFDQTHYITMMQQVAEAYQFDLATRASLTDFLPLTYRDIPILLLNARALDFPHEPRPIDHYVGPMIDLNRGQSGYDPQFANVWPQLLAKHEKTQHPLIYCSIGTYWPGNVAYLRRIITAVARRPDWSVVLSIGRMTNPDEFGDVPDNVHLFHSVPQLDVLQHADALITHGGIATINEAIWYGVPMLVLSTGHVDQNGCAARVVYHELGLIARRRGESPATILKKLELIIHTDLYRRNLAAMRAVFQQYREEKRAVAVIERLLPAQGGAAQDTGDASPGGVK